MAKTLHSYVQHQSMSISILLIATERQLYYYCGYFWNTKIRFSPGKYSFLTDNLSFQIKQVALIIK